MVKPNRIHEQQLASIAQTMKDLYHVRRVDSILRIDMSENHTATRSVQKDVGRVGDNPQLMGSTRPKNSRPFKGSIPPESAPESALVQRELSSIKCFRCGDEFPQRDFLYTERSGLCISCWESKIKVA